jgi:hypothetical protein
MAETISMPKLGFDMAEGLLVRWVKQVGENINKGDVLAEIETDKATVEVESSASGVVLQLIVEQGTGSTQDRKCSCPNCSAPDSADSCSCFSSLCSGFIWASKSQSACKESRKRQSS